jgi:hypothetical protein
VDGTHPIVVNIRNSYQFFEHTSIDTAKAEAHRLAAKQGDGVFVVYVPVTVVQRTQPTVESPTRFKAEEELPF